ncbi:MAG: hypothetical protein JWR04_2176 [Rhodoglobus sp.]|nr:hypothetical protein [Rhodoglobus sp.]
MTDSTSWQPPAGAAPAAPPSPYASPSAPPPPPGSQPIFPPPAAPAGWTPPPKPGLIPLRPLTFGTLLGASFQVLRRNPRPTFGFALLVTGAIYIVSLGVVGFVTFFMISRAQFANSSQDAETLMAGSVGVIILSALVPAALAIVGSAILQGVISLEVARATLGEKLRLPGLWRGAKGRIGALIGWSGILVVAVILAVTIAAVLIGLLVGLGGTVGVVAGVLLGLLLGACAIALAIWLGTKLSLVPSALMLERLSLGAAIARSWSLTKGYFWKTFGILLLVSAIIYVVSSIVSTPLQLVVSFGSTFLDPNGTSGGIITGVIVVYVLTIVFGVVFGAIGAVVQAATPALLYIDIRMRKEGLDLELSRFVEARQAGDASVPDPYLPKAPTAAAAPTASPWS